MTTSKNNYDALESMIYDYNIGIKSIDFHPALDLMLIVLNTITVLRQRLSTYTRLQQASLQELRNYELIGNGVGVHWPALDEDLSLKGFLQQELRNIIFDSGKAVEA